MHTLDPSPGSRSFGSRLTLLYIIVHCYTLTISIKKKRRKFENLINALVY